MFTINELNVQVKPSFQAFHFFVGDEDSINNALIDAQVSLELDDATVNACYEVLCDFATNTDEKEGYFFFR